MCNGQLEGDALNSRELAFHPQAPSAGDYVFDIGSAGSTTLVLQTVLPILLFADEPSSVTIKGGTHNPMAPPVEFLAESFLPPLHRCGVSATVELARHGFYPIGGGVIRAHIQPWSVQVPLDYHQRGKPVARHAEVLVSKLPAHVATRESQALKHALKWNHQEVDEREVDADGPGNAIIARLRHAHGTTICAAFGEMRKPAENVARELVRQVRSYQDSAAPVCVHLADQLLLPLALGAGGSFRAVSASGHTTTNAAIINRFLGDAVALAPDGDGIAVTVRPRGS